jgi:signal transduction histidine kinase
MEAHLPPYSVQELGLLQGFPARSFDNLTELAASVFGVPVSLVSIIDEANDRQFFKSMHGLAEPWATQQQTPLSHSFCKFVVSEDAPLKVANAPEHPLVKDNGAIQALGVISYLGAPIHDVQGRAVGALCVIDHNPRQWSESDIATLTRFAACVDDAIRLKLALKVSQDLQEEQTEFAHAISHDVRGPIRTLNMLFGQLDQCHREGKTQEHQSFSEIGVEITNRMERLTEDLSKFTSASTPGQDEPIDLNDVLDAVKDDLFEQISASDATISHQCLPTVQGNPTQLRMLFQNLVSNAIKFQHPDRSPVIDITCASGPNSVEISVQDNGIGIAEEFVDRIFGLFKRLHSRSEIEGSGVGLALCARIARNIGGRIEVKSEPNTGTTFTLIVPKRS